MATTCLYCSETIEQMDLDNGKGTVWVSTLTTAAHCHDDDSDERHEPAPEIRRAFSIVLYMADTLNNDAMVGSHEPSDSIPAPGMWFGSSVPFVLDGLNDYIRHAFERAQR